MLSPVRSGGNAGSGESFERGDQRALFSRGRFGGREEKPRKIEAVPIAEPAGEGIEGHARVRVRDSLCLRRSRLANANSEERR